MESSEKPRIGVFLCECGGTVSSTLDMQEMTRKVIEHHRVIHIEKYRYLCSSETRQKMINSINKNDLDRVVIVACSPLLYMEEFRDTAEEAGLNRYMVEMANVREQCAWIHSKAPTRATDKAIELIHLALAKVEEMKPTPYGRVANVDTDLCDGCGICRRVCRLGAIEIRSVEDDGKYSFVDPKLCEGCGVCVSSCPSGAMDMDIFSNREMLATVQAATEEAEDGERLNVLVFACHWCSYAAADTAGIKRIQMDPGFKTIRTICSARVDPEWIIEAVSRGADGILVTGAEPGHCHYEVGSYRTRNRLVLLRILLAQLGFSEKRLQLQWIDNDEPDKFRDTINDFMNTIRDLGPSPFREESPQLEGVRIALESEGL